jgi:hypothetical protein
VLKKCSGPNCLNIEKTEKEFKLCGRCRQAKYCSGACQEKDWHAGHKAVCKAKDKEQ